MENKTIYFSYKNNIPYFVFNRWLHLNPQYEIDFSLDEDCRQFLNNEFNMRFDHQLKIKQIRIYETPNSWADAI